MRTVLRLGFLLAAVVVVADSPLTSTDIASAYTDVPAVSAALGAGGRISPALIAYLDDGAVSIDRRIAVINALGWGEHAADNLQTYLERVFINEKSFRRAVFGKGERPDRLLCSAYLAALSDYNDVEGAYLVAQKARMQRPDSYTYALIAALIRAQIVFDEDWCAVFETVYDVDANPKLIRDMRPEAVISVFEYIGLYRDYCR